MNSLHVLCLPIVFVCSVNAVAQDVAKSESKSPEMKQAIESFGKAIEIAKNRFTDAVGAAAEKYNMEVELLRNKQIELLESFQKAATQSNDLDEAIRIRDSAKSFRENKIELPDLQLQLAKAEETIRDLQRQIANLANTKNEKQNAKSGASVVGTWRWFDGKDTVFVANGQAVHAQVLYGKWRLNDGTKDSLSIAWQNGSTDTLKLLEDGRLLEGTASLDQMRVWAVRLK